MVSTHLKINNQNGNLPQIGMKINNVVSTHLKINNQNGNLPQIGMKINNVVSTHLKINNQNGNLPQIGMKINDVVSTPFEKHDYQNGNLPQIGMKQNNIWVATTQSMGNLMTPVPTDFIWIFVEVAAFLESPSTSITPAAERRRWNKRLGGNLYEGQHPKKTLWEATTFHFLGVTTL